MKCFSGCIIVWLLPLGEDHGHLKPAYPNTLSVHKGNCTGLRVAKFPQKPICHENGVWCLHSVSSAYPWWVIVSRSQEGLTNTLNPLNGYYAEDGGQLLSIVSKSRPERPDLNYSTRCFRHQKELIVTVLRHRIGNQGQLWNHLPYGSLTRKTGRWTRAGVHRGHSSSISP